MLMMALLVACTGGSSGDRPPGPTDTDPTSPPPPEPVIAFDGEPPANVLILSLDTVRRDRVGRYGDFENTPFLDGLFASGVALDDHRSCSDWTAPSMACAITGLFPPAHDFWPTPTAIEGIPSLPQGVQTLAKLFGNLGVHTRLVSANPTFSADVERLVAGFDQVQTLSWKSAAAVSAAGITALDEMLAAGGPWLLHLHYLDPHVPYCPPPAYVPEPGSLPDFEYDICGEIQSAVAAWPSQSAEWRQTMQTHVDAYYGGELAFLDDTLEQLWSDLQGRSAFDDTLVVLLSDHGEQFYEHGGHGHAYDLYGEENLALGAFLAPGLEPVAWTGPTTHADLFATIVDIYDLEPEVPPDGYAVGLAPPDRIRVAAQLRPQASPLASEPWSPLLLAAIGSTHTLHTSWDETLELYDLTTDPAEATDIYAASHPAAAPLADVLLPLLNDLKVNWSQLGDDPTPPAR
jgi:arylsulfatase A-like enzyme